MLCQRLAELRLENGLTKKKLGEVLNMTPEGYGHYESGKRKPTPDVIAMLSDFYNVSTDYLLGRTDDPIPPNEKNASQDDISLDDIEFALFGELRELDDEDKEELLRDARRMRELRELRKKQEGK